MRYRKPFTPEQRRQALAEYSSWRRHVYFVRKTYPPQDAQQRNTLREYEECVYAIGSELMKVDRLINVDELNALDRLGRVLLAEYYGLRLLK